MGAVDNQEQARKDKNRTGRQKMVDDFKRAAVVTEEQVGVSFYVIVEAVTSRMDERPGVPPAKLSLALMKGGDWCCSLNDWETREGVSCFASTPGRALVGLAEKLCNGEPWRALPKR